MGIKGPLCFLIALAAAAATVLSAELSCAAVISGQDLTVELAELYNNETVMIARFRNLVDSGQRQGAEAYFGANDLGCPQNRVQDDFAIGTAKVYWAKMPETNKIDISISRSEDVSFLELGVTDGAGRVSRKMRYPPSGTLSHEIEVWKPPTGGLPGCDPCQNCRNYSLSVGDINCVKIHVAASGNIGSMVSLGNVTLNGARVGDFAAEYGGFGDWALLPYKDADGDGYSAGCDFDISSGDIRLTADLSLSPPPTLGDDYAESNKVEIRFAHCPEASHAGRGCADITDCDDSNASIHQGALEICGDSIDQDCDGADTPCQPAVEGPENGSFNPPPAAKAASPQGMDIIPYAILAIIVIGAIAYLRYHNA